MLPETFGPVTGPQREQANVTANRFVDRYAHSTGLQSAVRVQE
jgi:hypothetical protein